MPVTLVAVIIVCDLLIVAGLAAFFLTGASHVTALIPTFTGLILQATAGVAVLMPSVRRSFMIVTAVLAVVGIAVALSRPILKVFAGATLEWNAALISQVIMALGCAAVCCMAIVFLLGPSEP
ncbi:hypothetical protein [Thermogutta sp.]|jgi:hypothetical protein|uniref:hypothetical protein n=1 Tax=Thermogutta sp. TaxID=1962930 RepID=UPI003220341C